MKRILLLFYSQSGEADRVATIFRAELEAAGHSVTAEMLRPEADYPYPWRSIRRFFDVMPETQLGLPPPIRPPAFDPAAGYDLIILVCPVWFLSPALPIQGFFRTPQAQGTQGGAGDDRHGQPGDVAAGLGILETSPRHCRRAPRRQCRGHPPGLADRHARLDPPHAAFGPAWPAHGRLSRGRRRRRRPRAHSPPRPRSPP